MEHYAGIDVSMEQSSLCVIDGKGEIVLETTVDTHPDGLRAALSRVHRACAGHVHAREKRTGHFWQGAVWLRRHG